ncbi:dephospho-CoA kinase [Lysinibacillus sp. KU-BSD001]|uniref:dephospho-CoA kinase n=1 Tax=Lysinibacillus sp. KU-BSD001 TaxID=3141328 RepID=UPI0036ED0718
MIIGLTGSIASGKSTVANMLAGYRLPIVDADLVARQVVEPGTETLAQIAQAFGADVIQEDGTMDREKVGAIIFHEPAKRKILNDIIHPAIRTEMIRQRDEYVAKGEKHIVMDIPLLFESKLQHFVDKILVVSVKEDIQLQRLMERNNLSEEEARARMASQLPMLVKEQGADVVIYNNRSIESTAQQLEAALKEWGII